MKKCIEAPSHFERLVLGCIDADFASSFSLKTFLTRSARFAFMRLLEKRTEVENEIMKMYNTEKAE